MITHTYHSTRIAKGDNGKTLFRCDVSGLWFTMYTHVTYETDIGEAPIVRRYVDDKTARHFLNAFAVEIYPPTWSGHGKTETS